MGNSVRILTTGGTIASTSGSDGATPTESGDDILATVPALRERVEIEVVTQRPSPDVDFTVLERLRERIASCAANTDSGIVVTHGTDTMAESAYYLDLVRTGGPPVVFTGAQRRPDQPGADGPANLLAAVNAAEESALQAAGGVYILLNDELHAARDVVKAHSWRPDAFASPGKGPIATLGPTGFEPYRDLGSRSATIPIDNPPSSWVEIISTGIGMNGHFIERAVEVGCEGLVLRATGLGNAPEPVAAAAGDAIDAGVPVVIATRCHSGGVVPVYGGGGGHTLREHGAAFADDLPASKARIKLLVALEAGLDPDDAFATE